MQSSIKVRTWRGIGSRRRTNSITGSYLEETWSPYLDGLESGSRFVGRFEPTLAAAISSGAITDDGSQNTYLFERHSASFE